MEQSETTNRSDVVRERELNRSMANGRWASSWKDKERRRFQMHARYMCPTGGKTAIETAVNPSMDKPEKTGPTDGLNLAMKRGRQSVSKSETLSPKKRAKFDESPPVPVYIKSEQLYIKQEQPPFVDLLGKLDRKKQSVSDENRQAATPWEITPSPMSQDEDQSQSDADDSSSSPKSYYLSPENIKFEPRAGMTHAPAIPILEKLPLTLEQLPSSITPTERTSSQASLHESFSLLMSPEVGKSSSPVSMDDQMKTAWFGDLARCPECGRNQTQPCEFAICTECKNGYHFPCCKVLPPNILNVHLWICHRCKS